MSQQSEYSRTVFHAVSEPELVALAQRMIRIPSFFFEEHNVADDLGEYLAEAGFDVDMMSVEHPWEDGKTTRQPIATLRGGGNGKTLMINGQNNKT